jgi:3-oxoacyl-[acyl-carrier protein] reductase
VLAEELKGSGVAVTVVCPDAIETPMLKLQEDFEEAALTFSGRAPLTVEDISDAVFDRILKDRPVEVSLPAARAFQARLAGAFPVLSRIMTRRLRARGLKKQQARRDGRG